MDRTATGRPPEQMLRVFEHGFAVLWRRAHQTLGDVTLTAILDRVLYNASEQFTFLSGLTIVPMGLSCGELHERASTLPHDSLAAGIRYVLVEFLTVLGSLTAEILTPALHAELAKVGPEGTGSPEKESPVPSQREDAKNGKDRTS